MSRNHPPTPSLAPLSVHTAPNDVSQLSGDIHALASGLGWVTCRPFDVGLLVPEERIRGYCRDNRCGRFGRHHMCPPAVGTLEEISQKLTEYHEGFLLQAVYPLEVRGDPEGVRCTKSDFHQKVLALEAFLKSRTTHVWGLIGGDCALCEPCLAARPAPCPYPEQARTSLESLGVDVIALLAGLGLDTGFYSDRITWTGCLLF